MSTLLEEISEGYQNALDNDYPLDEWTDEEVAHDMAAYHSGVEEYPFEEILEAVKSFRASR